jgi:hypothetical protein
MGHARRFCARPGPLPLRLRKQHRAPQPVSNFGTRRFRRSFYPYRLDVDELPRTSAIAFLIDRTGLDQFDSVAPATRDRNSARTRPAFRRQRSKQLQLSILESFASPVLTMISFSRSMTSFRGELEPAAAYREAETYTSGPHHASTLILPALWVPSKRLPLTFERTKVHSVVRN